ncbi:MAG: hypothetical protein Q8P24_13360, partial [Desulfobacterales bacterium]|nr:hypothetical protein [Desulfobacterales bacterium]
TTPDGGAYYGIVAGIKNSRELEGGLTGIYLAPDQTAGYLISDDLKGRVFPGLGPDNPDFGAGMFTMDGTLNRLEMETATGIDPKDFISSPTTGNSALTLDFFSLNQINAGNNPGDIVVMKTAYDPNNPSGPDEHGVAASIGNRLWGVWGVPLYGGTAGGAAPTTGPWTVNMTMEDQYAGPYGVRGWLEVLGSVWDENKTGAQVAGQVAGAWVSWDSMVPNTGVLGGKLAGTFNPASFTWEAVALGGWMETGRFLNLAKNNPAVLQALSIPSIQVGRTDLMQNPGQTVNNLSNVRMKDVTFFAFKDSAVPRIWATGDVGGDFSNFGPLPGSPGAPGSPGMTVPLKGNGLSVDFMINRWDHAPGQPGQWGADLKGGGTYTGPGAMNGSTVPMMGGAAGTILPNPLVTGAGTFSGTAAGTAQVPIPAAR